MTFKPQAYLDNLAALDDGDVDPGLAALALAWYLNRELMVERHANHLQKLSAELAAYWQELLDHGKGDDTENRLEALKHILSDRYDYTGDFETYDNVDNANLARVIDRGKGMPITLSILYIRTARSLGWTIDGLDIPGHFLCRMEKDGRRLIFDPFQDGKVLQASDIRLIVKKALGPQAELSAGFYEPASNRKILIRLQNNIKYRQIDMEDYQGALKTVESIRLIDPHEYRLYFDQGVLLAKTDQLGAAIGALEKYMSLCPTDRDRHDAALLLQQLKTDLH